MQFCRRLSPLVSLHPLRPIIGCLVGCTEEEKERRVVRALAAVAESEHTITCGIQTRNRCRNWGPSRLDPPVSTFQPAVARWRGLFFQFSAYFSDSPRTGGARLGGRPPDKSVTWIYVSDSTRLIARSTDTHLINSIIHLKSQFAIATQLDSINIKI